jgi:hypothetical protein
MDPGTYLCDLDSPRVQRPMPYRVTEGFVKYSL